MRFQFLLLGLILSFFSYRAFAQNCTPPIAIIETVDQTMCAPWKNGIVIAMVQESEHEYTFEWFKGTTTTTPVGIPPVNSLGNISRLINIDSGYYTVRITDKTDTLGFCPSIYTARINNRLDFPNASATVHCNGTNSSAIITVEHPSWESYYIYQWSVSDSFTPGTILPWTGDTLTNIGPGSYNGTVTNEFSGCKQAFVFTISSNAIDKIDQLSLNVSDNVICSKENGKIDVQVNHAGQQGNSFTWYEGTDINMTPLLETSNVLDSLKEGVYTYKMTDPESGCGVMTFGHVNFIPQLPRFNFYSTPQTNCDLNNPNATLIAQSLDEDNPAINFNFTFQFPPDAPIEPPLLVGSSSFWPNVRGGYYTIAIADQHSGCQSIYYETIPFDIVTPILGNIMVTCPTDANSLGSANVMSISPDSLAAYSFTWADLALNPIASGPMASGLAAGEYVVMARRISTGCQAMAEVSIVDQSSLSVSLVTVDQTSCDADAPSGSLTVNSSGGVSSDYTYEWHDGTDITSTVKSNLASYSGLASGDYTVVVTNNDCDIVKSGTVLTNITLPVIKQLLSGSNTSCIEPNGFLQAGMETGSSSDYKFTWLDASLNVLSETGATISGLEAETYQVKATSLSSQCESVSVKVDVFDAQVTPVLGAINTTTGTCGQPDGGLEVTSVTPGEISDYTFTWYKGINQIDGATGADISGLSIGDYSVLAINKSTGCISESSSKSISCITGIEKTPDGQFQIFPNPTQGDFHVTFSNPESQKVSVSLTDVSGKVHFVTETNGSELTMNRGTVAAGLYIVQMTRGMKMYYSKLVVN